MAVLSELGRHPTYYSIILATLSYLHRLESMPENSLLYNAYKESKILDSCNINSWFSNANYLCKKIDVVWSKCKSMKTTTLKKQLKKKYETGISTLLVNEKRRRSFISQVNSQHTFTLKQILNLKNIYLLKNLNIKKIYVNLG